MEFNFSFIKPVAEFNLNEAERLEVVNRLMAEGVRLSNVSFFTSGRDGNEYVAIRTNKTTGTSVPAKESYVNAIMKYLIAGEVSKMEVQEGDPWSNDAQMSILKLILESGKNVQIVPPYKGENSLMAVYGMRFGRINFRLERTEELVNLLREYKQAV